MVLKTQHCQQCGRKPPHTGAGRLRNSGRFSDIDAYREALDGWSLDIDQLSKGRADSFYDYLADPDFELLIFGHKQKSEHKATATAEGISFFVPDSSANLPLFYNKTLHHCFISATPQNELVHCFTFSEFCGYTLNITLEMLDEIARHYRVNFQKKLRLPKTTAIYPCDREEISLLAAKFREVHLLMRRQANCKCEDYTQINYIARFHIMPRLVKIMLQHETGQQIKADFSRSKHL